jgi:prepilin-type N-terminal cleavage/methylation domain-containing protein
MSLRKGRGRGFTLIELVMVILLLGILAAIAIPNFIDFRTDAKNAAVQGGLGTLRAGVAIAVAAIQLREDPTQSPAKYPTHAEMVANKFLVADHPVLAGQGEYILDSGSGIPKNPWTLSTLPAAHFTSIADCDAINKGAVLPSPADDRGWCYKEGNGNIWANSDTNGGVAAQTENSF